MVRDRDETETFDFQSETRSRPRPSDVSTRPRRDRDVWKLRLETVSRPRRRDRDYIPDLPTCPHSMLNFGPLAAEIVSLVWGTPANFYGFRILAASLHGTLVVGASQTLGVEQRAPPIFGSPAITLGIGPCSSLFLCL